jgi:hypothetical protein
MLQDLARSAYAALMKRQRVIGRGACDETAAVEHPWPPTPARMGKAPGSLEDAAISALPAESGGFERETAARG